MRKSRKMEKICKKIGLEISGKTGILETIFLLSPVVVWFSFWPQISLGRDATTNFKLTIPMIYLAILAVFSLPKIVKNSAKLFSRKTFANWLLSAFVLYNFASVFWSLNKPRTILTAGIVALLFVAYLSALFSAKFIKENAKNFAKIYVFSAILMGIFALIQFIYGTFFESGLLLCAGCVSGQFGFVRPNVFAIEPQFLGSLLVPAILIIFHEILVQKNSISRNLMLGFLAFSLFLTLSRGAIFAMIFGLILVAILSKTNWKNIGKSFAIGTLSLLFCLVFQGVFAEINPNVKTDFSAAVNSSLNQLSMGIIKIRESQKVDENQTKNEDKNSVKSNVEEDKIAQKNVENKPAFSGYVAESTNVRTGLSKIAFDTWKNGNIREKILGFGLGSSGVAMEKFTKNGDTKEIVQNEFIEKLLELGVFGLALFLLVLIGFTREILRSKDARWMLGIFAAFVVQWMFFSGYPSAIHVYLILIFISIQSKKAK